MANKQLDIHDYVEITKGATVTIESSQREEQVKAHTYGYIQRLIAKDPTDIEAGYKYLVKDTNNRMLFCSLEDLYCKTKSAW